MVVFALHTGPLSLTYIYYYLHILFQLVTRLGGFNGTACFLIQDANLGVFVLARVLSMLSIYLPISRYKVQNLHFERLSINYVKLNISSIEI